MSHLGSASWTNAEDYQPDDVFRVRAERLIAKVDWHQIAATAAKLRQDTPCSVCEKFTIGHFNLVRQIIFADGVCWIVRLRLPDLPGVFGRREKLDAERCMQIEIATMEYLRAKTSIPVPELFYADLNQLNDVGAAFMLTSYIHGTTAEDLQQQKGCEINLYGTPEQDQRFRKQVASIQVQLAALRFNQIGSLYLKGGDFVIGPEVQTGKGPWSSPEDYYADLAQHVSAVAANDAPFHVLNQSSIRIPIMFPRLMKFYDENEKDGSYGLANRDLGAHNLLVNNDFEIVGLIDVNGVMAAPVEVIAQFPFLDGLSRAPPGHVETRPLAIERIKRDAPLLEEYKHMVQDAENSLNSGGARKSPVADCLMSDAASLVQGLEDYGGYQIHVHQAWMTAYESLFKKKEKEFLSTVDVNSSSHEEWMKTQRLNSDDDST